MQYRESKACQSGSFGSPQPGDSMTPRRHVSYPWLAAKYLFLLLVFVKGESITIRVGFNVDVVNQILDGLNDSLED